MGAKIWGLLVLIALCASGYYLWQRHQLQMQETNGAVHCIGCMTPEQKARFDKDNSGDTPDGSSERKERSARQDSITGSQNTPVTTDASSAAATTTDSTTAAAPTTAAPMVAAPTGSYGVTNASPATAPPVSDTQPPNATNGTRFGGSGHYEWYRQGNLTWRLDPRTGESCIAFATLEEWQKQIVYSHGCGRGA